MVMRAFGRTAAGRLGPHDHPQRHLSGSRPVAGAVASLFGWGIVEDNQITMSQASVKSYLIWVQEEIQHPSTPTEEWGYGALDLYETFRRIRGITLCYGRL